MLESGIIFVSINGVIFKRWEKIATHRGIDGLSSDGCTVTASARFDDMTFLLFKSNKPDI